MKIKDQIDVLMSSLEDGKPLHEIMRAAEEEHGWTVVLPGSVPWLSTEDWHPTIVVSRRGKYVRLVALYANNPGHGAFRRTIAAITGAGLVPIISAPTREMRATLQRWGWKEQIVGSGWNVEELWRPSKRAHVPKAVEAA